MGAGEGAAGQELSVLPQGQIFFGPAETPADAMLLLAGGRAPISVEMAVIETPNEFQKNDVLMKIQSAGIPGSPKPDQVLRYQAVPAGTGDDFRYTFAGQEKTRLSSRDTWGAWTLLQIHVGGKSIHLRPDPRGVTDARPLHLLTAYRAALGEAPSRLNLERSVAGLNQELATNGWPQLTIRLEWSTAELNEVTRIGVGGILRAMPAAMKAFASDEMARDILRSFKGIVIMAAATGGLVVTKSGENLVYAVGPRVADDQAVLAVADTADWIRQATEAIC